MKLKKYDVALATRNFEIELFWKRSLFFWGFIASAFVGYATLVKDKPTLSVLIVCFGFVCSVAWSLVNRGSKYWQENWESIVVENEIDITGELFKHQALQQKKGFWLTSRKFSVSKVTIALSDFTVIIWASLMAYHLFKATFNIVPITSGIAIIGAIIFSIVFTVMMICKGRSSDANNP